MKTLGIATLAFYVLCSLIGMAPMNIGFGVMFLFLLPQLLKKPKLIFEPFQSIPDAKSYLKWAGMLALACTVSLLAMHFYPYSYAEHAPVLTAHAFLKLWHLLIPGFVTLAFVKSDYDYEVGFRFLTRTWWATTLCLLLVAIIQFNTGWPQPQVIPTNPSHFHAILFLGHHLSVSSVLIFPTFTALAISLGNYTRKKTILWFETLTALAGLCILFLSYARTAWLAIPIGIIFIFIRFFKPRTLIMAVLSLFLVIGIASQTPAMKERIQNSMGIQDRLRLWEANIDFFKHRPITGIGWLATQEMSQYYFKEKVPEHYQEYFWGHAHSNIFEMLGGAGLLGLISFLLFAIFTIRMSLRTSQLASQQGDFYLADFAWGIGVALLLLHFNGLTNVTFWEGKVIHQQMLCIGLLMIIQFLLNYRLEAESRDARSLP